MSSLPIMPELPEVETIVRRLSTFLVGRSFTKVEVHREKSWSGDINNLLNNPISHIERRAKLIIFSFKNSQKQMIVHLKMTGQLILVTPTQQRVGGGHPTKDFTSSLPSKHTRISFILDDASLLYFNDIRVFGWCRLLDQEEVSSILSKIGPDINNNIVTADWMSAKLQAHSTPIKQIIMDSKFVAGVGNIYACDGLHLAGILPTRPSKSLSKKEIIKLLESLRTVIDLGINLNGATIADYRTADGLMGGYQDVMRVYAREGKPCIICGEIILRIKQGGRSTFYCPKCQV